MQAFIVVPCLNEECYLEQTCASLGFGDTTDPPVAELVLIDNGSTDRTAEAMRRVQQRAGVRDVHLVTEATRGFVPARRAGLAKVQDLIVQRGIVPSDVLVIQADADTHYSEGYAAALVDAAKRSDPGTLLEARTIVPASFAQNHPDYVALCNAADAGISSLLVPASQDVIVDDKACAYRLADYAAWGGLRREYGERGEILAETSRLYMRARSLGAKKISVDAAVAASSRRRVLEHPALQFATAGFPRGEAWSRDWCRMNADIDSFEAMMRNGTSLNELLFFRRAHSLVLFSLLPAWIGRATATTISNSVEAKLKPLLDFLPRPSIEQLRQKPGWIIERALGIVDAYPQILQYVLTEHAGCEDLVPDLRGDELKYSS